DLPTYVFDRERYWLQAADGTGDVTAVGLDRSDHPLLGATVRVAGGDSFLFTGKLSAKNQPWLTDHRAGGVMVLPGTAMVDVLAHAGLLVHTPVIEELTISSPVVVPETGGADLQIAVGELIDGRRTVRLYTRGDGSGEWTEHAAGTVAEARLGTFGSTDLTAWPPTGASPVDLDGFYDKVTMSYGPSFHAVRAAWLDGERVYAEIELPESAVDRDTDAYGLHPVVLDAAFHVLGVSGFFADPDQPRLAFSWSGVRLHATGARALRVVLAQAGPDAISIAAADDSGAPVVDIDSVVVRPVALERLGSGAAHGDHLYEVDWVPAAAGADVGDWAYLEELGDETPSTVVLRVDSGDPTLPVPDRVHATGLRVLRTLQEWLADPRRADARLVVVTVADDLVQQALHGLVRTAQSENPNRFVLLETTSPDELGIGLSIVDEPHVAVRDGVVLVARLKRVRAASRAGESTLRGGTVLVTGATGGLGRHLTEHLVHAHGVAELVLVTRSGADETWVAELRAAGTSVRVVVGDAADRTVMTGVVESVVDSLTAVVHVAGVVDDAVIAELTPRQWDDVLRAKVDAVWLLHELTKNLDLAAFVVYSSASATFGGAGQGNYAAGNAFLDGFARHRHTIGLPAVSLAWGLWAEEAGMRGRLSDVDVARMARNGTLPLSTEQGLALFDAALESDRPALVPIRLDLAKVRGSAEMPALLRSLAPPAARRAVNRGQGGDESLVRRLSGRTVRQQEELLLELVRANAAGVLGHAAADAIDAQRAFKELGFDSLTAVELRNRLTESTGVRLPATLVFNYPTPQDLAAHLRVQLLGDTAHAPVVATRTAAAQDEPIAIVSMACRFPGGVSTPDELWDLVATGGDAISGLPTDRGWNLDDIYDADPDTPGKTYVRGGGFLDGVADFDAGFFGVSPREALAMDPQQRLLLEVSWEAFERAGLDPASLRGTDVGVFVGTHGQDYGSQVVADQMDEGYLVIGKAGSVLSGRVAYTFGLEGPAMTVDTACSSSLVALHLAVQALRNGECSMALAGGVSIMTTLDGVIGFSRQRGLAADGRCKSFADSADGFGMSEGGAVLLVERLSDARRRGHEVLAVVRGSAVNQDGASNGLTAPNGPSQERVIRSALVSAGLSFRDVDVVEAHGTGTTLGDPIEAQALLATYGQDRDVPLWLGSVKSNIGHTQAAAGVAGVIKMVLAMRHGVLPKTLHVDTPSSHIDWSAGAVELLTESLPWMVDRVRRAGVSSFGVSGTNAHVIVEQAPAVAAEPAASVSVPAVPLLLSGRSAASVRGVAGRLAERLSEVSLLDAAATLSGRAVFGHRAVVVASDEAEAVAGLRELAAVSGGGAVTGKTAFVFPGQGSQWLGMGAQLFLESEVFAARLRECAEALASVVDFDVLAVIRGDVVDVDVERVDVVQPLSFAVMVSLAAVWVSYGVVPDAVVGHSQGEIAAAVVSGALSLEDGARVVGLRSQLIGRVLAGRGGMMSVAVSAERIGELLCDGVELAAVNGPESVVVAGDV
ncbi:SDR family NAD(P)-dependent oxidoreductase, partial [Kutzneria sp. NPDC051319]|uniref:SDR family NAD(P)-dependent oxidoreductase n=1 Tax=Kutzneria sp. NPDC051319 TaxID=3155047 RepID=UPI003414E281